MCHKMLSVLPKLIIPFQSAFDTFRITQKYALKWRYITTERLSQRPTRLPGEKSTVREKVTRPETVSMVTVEPSLNKGGNCSMPHDPALPVLRCASSPVIHQRPKPRKPDFLKDSLKRLGLHSSVQEM